MQRTLAALLLAALVATVVFGFLAAGWLAAPYALILAPVGFDLARTIREG